MPRLQQGVPDVETRTETTTRRDKVIHVLWQHYPAALPAWRDVDPALRGDIERMPDKVLEALDEPE